MKTQLLTSALVLSATVAVTAAQSVTSASPIVAASHAQVALESMTIQGTIALVDLEGSTFVIRTDEKRVTLKIDGSTSYTVNGTAATKEATLKVGAKAVVVHGDDSLATKVSVTEKEPA